MSDRFCWLFVTGINSQTLHQPQRDVRTVEGAAVTLDCSSDSLADIWWDKQEVNSLPDFILSKDQVGQGKKAKKYSERFRSRMDASARQAFLHIEGVNPSDLGVFYCAQRLGGFRLRPGAHDDTSTGVPAPKTPACCHRTALLTANVSHLNVLFKDKKIYMYLILGFTYLPKNCFLGFFLLPPLFGFGF
uniref:Ig-like domain-containing protein n=1 Tax=Hippocampus comes TaxID=109280 RepID=A0A3Q2XAY0_HIPCM